MKGGRGGKRDPLTTGPGKREEVIPLLARLEKRVKQERKELSMKRKGGKRHFR